MNTATTDLTEICSRVREFIRGTSAAGFERLALEVFKFQFTHNRVYRSLCEHQGKTLATVESWSVIPAVITSAFKDLELTALAPSERTAVFHSSGTTQHRPSRHFHSKQTLEVYETSLGAWFAPHVLPEGRPIDFLILAPRAEEVPHSSLAHMFTVVARQWGANEPRFLGQASNDGSWTVDFSRMERPSSPVVICGTAFSFVHWCDYLAEQNRTLSFPTGSRVFETGGYKGRSRAIAKSELHALITARLGIPPSYIISEYGMSELSSQAYDQVAGRAGERIFRFPSWARALIISPETGREAAVGETGLVRVYDLANVGSALAIQTEDLAVRRADGFELIGRAALAEPRGCSLLEAGS